MTLLPCDHRCSHRTLVGRHVLHAVGVAPPDAGTFNLVRGAMMSNRIDATPKERIHHKVVSVVERVLRGRGAANRWQVTFYRYHRGVTAVLSVLAGIGLTQADVSQGLVSQQNAPFLAGLGAILLATSLELYKAFNVEEVAIHSIAARDAFSLVEENLRIALQEPDPMTQLNIVFEESKTLLRNFHKVMPAHSDAIAAEASRISGRLIEKNTPFWEVPDIAEGDVN